tara:strand:- start:192 stop:509 length:318 start_codon:yes stop_codon:yes gene_type:complete
MSEEEKKDHPYSDDQLFWAVSEIGNKTANAKCPFCNHERWTLESENIEDDEWLPRVSYTMMTNRAFFGPAPSVPVITLICNNCGFTRHHNIPMLLTHREKAGKDE